MSFISLYAFSSIWDEALRFMSKNKWSFDEETLNELVCVADIIHADICFCLSNGDVKLQTLSHCPWQEDLSHGGIAPSDINDDIFYEWREGAIEKYERFYGEYEDNHKSLAFDAPLLRKLGGKSKEDWKEIITRNKPFEFIYRAGGRPVEIETVIESYSTKQLGVIPSLFCGVHIDEPDDSLSSKAINSPLHSVYFI